MTEYVLKHKKVDGIAEKVFHKGAAALSSRF